MDRSTELRQSPSYKRRLASAGIIPITRPMKKSRSSPIPSVKIAKPVEPPFHVSFYSPSNTTPPPNGAPFDSCSVERKEEEEEKKEENEKEEEEEEGRDVLATSLLVNLFSSSYFVDRQFVYPWADKIKRSMEEHSVRTGRSGTTTFQTDLCACLYVALFSPFVVRIETSFITLFSDVSSVRLSDLLISSFEPIKDSRPLSSWTSTPVSSMKSIDADEELATPERSRSLSPFTSSRNPRSLPLSPSSSASRTSSQGFASPASRDISSATADEGESNDNDEDDDMGASSRKIDSPLYKSNLFATRTRGRDDDKEVSFYVESLKGVHRELTIPFDVAEKSALALVGFLVRFNRSLPGRRGEEGIRLGKDIPSIRKFMVFSFLSEMIRVYTTAARESYYKKAERTGSTCKLFMNRLDEKVVDQIECSLRRFKHLFGPLMSRKGFAFFDNLSNLPRSECKDGPSVSRYIEKMFDASSDDDWKLLPLSSSR